MAEHGTPTAALEPTLTAHDVAVLRALPASTQPGARLVEDLLTRLGLAHLGYAVEKRGGWWTRTAKGDAYLGALDAPASSQGTLA